MASFTAPNNQRTAHRMISMTSAFGPGNNRKMVMLAAQPFNTGFGNSRGIRTSAVGSAASKARVTVNMKEPYVKKGLDLIDRFMDKSIQVEKKKDLDFMDDFLDKKGFLQK